MNWVFFIIGGLFGLFLFGNLPAAILSGIFVGKFLFGDDGDEISWGWFVVGFVIGWVLLNSVLIGILLGIVLGLLIFGR